VLLALASARGSMTRGDIAEVLGIAKVRALALQPLIDGGLVRQQWFEDLRENRLSSTPEGREVAAAIQRAGR
jgi:hypothetical protein